MSNVVMEVEAPALSPAQILARLDKLLGNREGFEAKAIANLYDSIQMASVLLADKSWLEETKMDEARATEFLEARYFRDLAGVISLPKMLSIYRWNNDRNWWLEQRNIKIVHKHFDREAYWTGKTPPDVVLDPPPQEKRFVPVSELKSVRESLEDKAKHHQAIGNHLRKELEKRDESIARMTRTLEDHQKKWEPMVQRARTEAERLADENRLLQEELRAAKDRIAELERLLKERKG